VTGWLTDESGKELGFQITFFRTRPNIDERNPSRFARRQVLFAHAALSDPDRKELLHDQRAARAGFDLAEAREGRVDVFIDDWSLSQADATYHTKISAQNFKFDLTFARTQPPLLEGEAGFSRKSASAGAASYYYSLPHLEVSGSLERNAKQVSVRGVAWLDHEWSSSYIDPTAVGWDWIGINLDDGGALMAFRMRDADGHALWSSATIRTRNGAAFDDRSYQGQDIEWQTQRAWRSARTQTNYPVEWRVRVGPHAIRLKPLMDNQESDTRQSTGTIYWEGAVTALDEQDKRIGRGYLELTGYNGKLSVGAK
jgi:predicted secreted hydrolase